jgi:hypothetical protein
MTEDLYDDLEKRMDEVAARFAMELIQLGEERDKLCHTGERTLHKYDLDLFKQKLHTAVRRIQFRSTKYTHTACTPGR